MFDQSFSPQNLRKITEIENRRGSNKSFEFFPPVLVATEELKDCIRATKHFRATHKHKYSVADQAIFDALKEDRENARKARDQELLSCLANISDEISKKSFRIRIRRVGGPNGKPVYIVPETPLDAYAQSYYAIKQIANNISRIYKVRQANRNRIVTQLSDGFPYHVVKLDVQEFYESVDHSVLLTKLKSDQLLSATTMRLIERLLWDYAAVAGTPGRGLPRGVGLSAILSELYMRDFDDRISTLEEVAFYARYVDDIIILFAPTKGSTSDDYRKAVVEELRRKRLVVNASKSTEARPATELTYLGYKFRNVRSTSCTVLMSDAKFQKYKKRLNACFTRYNRQRARKSKKAYRLLVKRVQYLTGNTQLTHSKQNAFVGIYFSNPHLTDLSQLQRLDDALATHIGKLAHSASLRTKLQAYSFHAGYSERTFRRFHRLREFEEITKAWKYGQ
ncbi:antiviral reverse transcriptase Drt3a [uncultured Roseobacter sp.]|uniref:antiviral reverse transcriptase Drt3a n=1 Tax=uncultured Roseobacter sp. TaxID=114847 RepID=UPI00260FF343|nr:antiviral reverse transcriptase Drt3a [uncultured Roseobacter sp.]